MEEPFIELHYGPYESHGVIRHKIQRLHGISGNNYCLRDCSSSINVPYHII